VEPKLAKKQRLVKPTDSPAFLTPVGRPIFFKIAILIFQNKQPRYLRPGKTLAGQVVAGHYASVKTLPPAIFNYKPLF